MLHSSLILTTHEYGRGNAFGHICLCVCLSVHLLLTALTQKVHCWYLQNFTVKFIYKAHQIKVNVTGAKRHEISSSHPFCGKHGTVLLQLQ